MNEFLVTLLEGAAPLLFRLLGIIILGLIGYGIKLIGDKYKIDVVQKALKVIEEISFNAVKAGLSEARLKYEEAMEDGKLTKDEIAEIKEVAINRAMDELPKLVKKLLGLAEEGLEELIEDLVEKHLGQELGKFQPFKEQ
ncbi:MAG: hypothetical protein ACOCRO_01940 [Halanaerobiales bacterium]